MDYANRQRLKLMGRLRLQESADTAPDLLRAVELPAYRARVERVALVEIEAFDWNCPQHITQRFTLAQVESVSLPLRERINELEAEVRNLRERISPG